MPVGVGIAELEGGGQAAEELRPLLGSEVVGLANPIEHPAGVGELPLDPQPAQPAPDHELREEEVARVRARLPEA